MTIKHQKESSSSFSAPSTLQISPATAKDSTSAVATPDAKSSAKKLRAPSYTDRVMVYSIRDREDRLTVQAYDLCDSMRISDHRPDSDTSSRRTSPATSDADQLGVRSYRTAAVVDELRNRQDERSGSPHASLRIVPSDLRISSSRSSRHSP